MHSRHRQRHRTGPVVNLVGADLRFANMADANLRGAALVLANLARADLSDTDLSLANLARADLEEADLSFANLYGATLIFADLTGANLTGADFSGADLTDASLTDVTLVFLVAWPGLLGGRGAHRGPCRGAVRRAVSRPPFPPRTRPRAGSGPIRQVSTASRPTGGRERPWNGSAPPWVDLEYPGNEQGRPGGRPLAPPARVAPWRVVVVSYSAASRDGFQRGPDGPFPLRLQLADDGPPVAAHFEHFQDGTGRYRRAAIVAPEAPLISTAVPR